MTNVQFYCNIETNNKNGDIVSAIKLDKYVVAGEVSYADLEFLGFDSASGGYPYASNWIRNVYNTSLDAWKDLPEATSDYVRMKDPKVYRIVLEEVDMMSYERDQHKVETVLNMLTKEQKQFLKEML